MIRLQSVSASNIILYDEVSFNFDQKGISYVTGVNRNSELTKDEVDDPNGTGKSLFFSLVANLRYRDSMGNTRRDGTTALFNKASEVAYKLSVGSDQYEITKRGSGQRYSILKNGEDTEARTPTIAEGLIDNLIDWSEEEFYTYVYLDSRRASVFQTGTATARFAYFTSVFRELQEYDKFRSNFDLAATKLRAVATTRKLRATDLEQLGEIPDPTKAQSAIDDLNQQLKEIEANLTEYGQQVEWRKLATRYGDDLKRSRDYNKSRYIDLSEQLAAHRAYRDAAEDLTRIMKLRQKAIAEFEKGAARIGLKDASYTKQGVVEYNNRVDEVLGSYRKKASAWMRESDAAASAKEQLADLDADERKYLKLRSELEGMKRGRSPETIRAEIDRLETDRRHLKVHKAGVCDVCGSKLDAKAAKERLEALTKQIAAQTKHLEAAKDYEVILRKADGLWSKDKAANQKKLRKIKSPGKEPVEPKLEGVTFHKEPRLIVPSGDYKQIKREFEEQAAARDAWTLTKPIKDKIEKGLTVTDKDVDAYRVGKKSAKKIRKRIYGLERELGAAREKRKNARNLTRDIAGYDKQLIDQALIESLAEAFSKKGIKIDATRAITEEIQKNLNAYSSLLFLEPFEFEIIVGENQFDITVIRPNGVASDVRRLSGAEARQFALLWMISILPLIPEERRVNTVILDEFEAGMGHTRRDRLRKVFLPKLANVVDHIVFITPLGVERSEGDRRYMVEKIGNKSTLKELS